MAGSTGISGVVLAGGLGRRMGGDKGLQLLHGRPLAGWACARLAPQVDDLSINANEHPERYAALGYPVIGDRIGGFAGPLAGLHAALVAATHDLVAVVPCDSPGLPDDLVARLRDGLVQAAADIAVARCGDRVHPVFCLARRSLAPALEAYLASGERRVGAWLAIVRSVEVPFDDCPEAFENLNTPADLARFAGC